jgi:hypothetical protein
MIDWFLGAVVLMGVGADGSPGYGKFVPQSAGRLALQPFPAVPAPLVGRLGACWKVVCPGPAAPAIPPGVHVAVTPELLPPLLEPELLPLPLPELLPLPVPLPEPLLPELEPPPSPLLLPELLPVPALPSGDPLLLPELAAPSPTPPEALPLSPAPQGRSVVGFVALVPQAIAPAIDTVTVHIDRWTLRISPPTMTGEYRLDDARTHPIGCAAQNVSPLPIKNEKARPNAATDQRTGNESSVSCHPRVRAPRREKHASRGCRFDTK